MSCIPSVLDVALEWSYNDSDISNSPKFQFTPTFLSHDLTIIHATDTDSGTYVCAFRLRNEVIDQESIMLTVAPSERNYECVQLMIYIRILLWVYPFNMFLLFTSLFARLFWWFFVAYK